MRSIFLLITDNPIGSGIFFCLLLLTPYFLLGPENCYYPILDNFDGSISIYKYLAESDYYWKIAPETFVDGFMNNSVPRNVLPSALSISSLMFYFLEPAQAYLTIKVLSHLIGFIGFYLLINHIADENRNRLLKMILGLSFAFINNHIAFGMGVYTAAPLVLYAFLKYVENDRYSYLILAFILPFTTSLVLTNFFLIIYLLIFTTIIGFRKNVFKPYFLIFYTLGSILSDINLIVFKLYENFESNRVLRSNYSGDFLDYCNRVIQYIKSNHINQQESSHVIPLILSGILLLSIYFYFEKVKFNNELKINGNYLKFIFAIYIVNIALTAIPFLGIVYDIPYLGEFASQFNLSRFVTLNPTFVWLLIGYSILFASTFSKNNFKLRLIIHFFAFICFLYVLKNNHSLRNNYNVYFSNYDKETIWNSRMGGSFKDFYSPKLFSKLNYDRNYSFICVGIHPSVLIYNNIRTFDGYFNIYKLEHKEVVNKVIEDEIKGLKINDNGGNMAYIFCKQLVSCWAWQQEIISKTNSKCPKTISTNLNIELLAKYKVGYVCSTVKIEQKGFHLLQELEESDSPYHLYIYSIIK